MDAQKDNATVQGGEVAGSHANAKTTGGDYTQSFGGAVKPCIAPLKFAFVDSQASPVRELKTMSFGELSAMLSAPTISSTKFGTAWIPADIEPGARTGDRVQSVSCLVLDVEAATSNDPQTKTKTVTGTEPPPFAEIVTELCIAGFAFILHTSYSHHDPAILPVDIQHPRYRIIFALSRPLAKDEVRPLALHIAGRLGLSDCVDTSCMEPARLYFMPRVPAERLDQYQHAHFEGAPLDVDALLNDARREADALAHISRGTMAQRDSVIDAFNEAHSPGAILENHGYVPHRNRWMHPNSTSGLPGVRLLPDSHPERVYSSHSNDPLNDGHAHDAFDCYRILVHGGDFKASVKAAAYLLGMNGATRANPATIFAGGVPPPPSAAGVALFDAPALPVADVRDGTTVTRSLTELGNAQRMADLHGDGVRYVPETKGWLYWHDGAAWQWDTSGTVMRELAAQLPRVIYSEGAHFDMTQAEHCAKWARKSQTAQVIGNAVSLLTSQSSIRLSLAMIDADRWLIGFDHARQVIDLRAGIARAATPADYITKSLAPCTMGDSAMAVRWLAFLDQIFAGDVELVGWLHRWCGYLLTGETSEQIFLFFFGLGANGKSVFAETIRHVMGDYARTVASETLAETKRQAGGASPDLADLIGCRLALSTETEDGSALAESLVKTITGGDAITARPLYCGTIQFTPAFKLLMLGNHRPIIRGTDHGIWRRVRLVRFARTFTEQERDPQLLDKLKAEAPHILAWMVAGCLEWQRRGLADVPATIANQTAEYRAEQDVIGQWLADCTTAARDSETETGALYDSYRIWAINSGLKPASKVSLGRRLSERGFVQRQTHGRRLWCGIALKFNAGTSFAK